MSTGVNTAVSGVGSIGGSPSPSSSVISASTLSFWKRVPLVPPATQGWPVPLTKNMYSRSTCNAPKLQSARLRSVCTCTVSVPISPR